MTLDPHWRSELAGGKVATPPANSPVLAENDLHPDPARLQAAIRQLEIRVQALEAIAKYQVIPGNFLDD